MEDFVHQPMRLLAVAGPNGSRPSRDQTEAQKIQVTPMEWTDEKHSLYLKSMEASFLDQLYSTCDLNDWHSQKEGLADTLSSRKTHASSYVPSGQFKVLQDGCWSKKNFRRDESKMAKASSTLPQSPWIRHFKSASRQQTAPDLGFPAKTAPALQQFLVCGDYLCQQDSTSNAEVSDQNFPDEGVAKERISITKRKKTSLVSNSVNDQVVPLGLFPMAEDITEIKTAL